MHSKEYSEHSKEYSEHSKEYLPRIHEVLLEHLRELGVEAHRHLSATHTSQIQPHALHTCAAPAPLSPLDQQRQSTRHEPKWRAASTTMKTQNLENWTPNGCF